MKITAGLGVKDEVELIGRAIAHLYDIGVDHVVAVDFGSSDGTLEQLEAHAARGDFTLVRGDDSVPGAIPRWIARGVDEIRATAGDWAIVLDADEFWLPASGNLKTCGALNGGEVLSVSRFNVPAGPEGAILPARFDPSAYEQILLVTEPLPALERHLAENPGTPWIRGVPLPKVMAPVARIGEVHAGGHAIARPDGSLDPGLPVDDIVIAHVPFSTPERFARKLENARKVFEVNRDMPGGWHWRRWLKLPEQDANARFAREVFGHAVLADYRASGVIRSVAEVFADRGVGSLNRA